MVKDGIYQMGWTESPSVLCLGLGTPSESRSARLQLALVMEIIGALKIVRLPRTQNRHLILPATGQSILL
jgi:hypothetical protein